MTLFGDLFDLGGSVDLFDLGGGVNLFDDAETPTPVNTLLLMHHHAAARDR